MYDQSFSKKTLARVLQKRDFYSITDPDAKDLFREDLLNNAVTSANSAFGHPTNPLISFPLKGRMVFMFSKLSDELVARKLCENIKMSHRIITSGRSQIICKLRLLLTEGVPFRIYRLDIKSFYESFQSNHVISTINEINNLNPQSKKLLQNLFNHHAALGGNGIPRGLSLSATLSDLLMQPFDHQMQSNDEIFFYSRYVDDIIVVTSSREDVGEFVRSIKNSLPPGLTLNTTKKQIVGATDKVTPPKPSEPITQLFDFDYLGYSFTVKEPKKEQNKPPGSYHRSVIVDIAKKKITRFKTRISRSFLEFSRTNDWELLKDRIKFLTKNFSVYNVKAGGKKMAGIFHSYPLVSDDAKGLKILDNFLRNAILSKNGRISSLSSPKLTTQQKKELLAQSFAKGHLEKNYVHFSGTRFEQIQKCWKN